MSLLRGLAILSAFTLIAGLAGFAPDLPLVAVSFVGLLVAQLASRLRTTSRTDARRWLGEHRFELGLASLAIVAVVLQASGLWEDIGRTPLDIDENRLATTVRAFFQSGEIPHRTVEDYPGIFYWLVVASYVPAFLIALSTGATTSFGALPQEYLVAVGRAINVPLYAATVVLVGYLGRRCAGSLNGRAGDVVGLVAATLMAFSSMGSRITAQFRNEPAVLLLVAASLLAATMLQAGGRRRVALAAGALAGLACGVKYTGVFALFPVLGAVLWPRQGKPRWDLAAWAIGGFAATLLVSNPFLWLDFDNFIRQLATEIQMTGAGHWAATENPAAVYRSFLMASFGIVPMLLVGAVAIWALVRPLAELRLLLLFWIPYQVFMTRQASQFERWVYLLLPPIACLVARGTVEIATWLAPRIESLGPGPRRAWRSAVVVVTLLFIAPSMGNALVLASRRVRPSTLDLVENWLLRHVESESSVLVEDRWLELGGAPFTVTRTRALRETMSESVLAVGAFEWLVVPEPSMDSFEAGDLELAHLVVPRRSFGGNIGFDFAIYRARQPDLIQGPRTIDFVARRGRKYVAGGWRSTSAGEGRSLDAPLLLYLPLVPQRAYSLRLSLTPSARFVGPPGPTVRVNGAAVELRQCNPEPVDVATRSLDWECEFVVGAELVSDRVDRFEIGIERMPEVRLRQVWIGIDSRFAPPARR